MINLISILTILVSFAAAIAGFIYDITWAKNISMFYIYSTMLINVSATTLFYKNMIDESKKQALIPLIKNNRFIFAMSVTTVVIETFIFAAFAYFFLASASTITLLYGISLYIKKKELLNEYKKQDQPPKPGDQK